MTSFDLVDPKPEKKFHQKELLSEPTQLPSCVSSSSAYQVDAYQVDL